MAGTGLNVYLLPLASRWPLPANFPRYRSCGAPDGQFARQRVCLYNECVAEGGEGGQSMPRQVGETAKRRSASAVGGNGRAPRAEAMAPPPVPTDANLYLNRELSLLAFFRRVLEEAQDE